MRARFISRPVPLTPVWCLQALHLAENAVHTTLPASLRAADPVYIYYDLIPPPAVLSSCFTFLEPPDCPVRLITPRLPASDCLRVMPPIAPQVALARRNRMRGEG